jgi:hypothetical protein
MNYPSERGCFSGVWIYITFFRAAIFTVLMMLSFLGEDVLGHVAALGAEHPGSGREFDCQNTTGALLLPINLS